MWIASSNQCSPPSQSSLRSLNRRWKSSPTILSILSHTISTITQQTVEIFTNHIIVPYYRHRHHHHHKAKVGLRPARPSGWDLGARVQFKRVHFGCSQRLASDWILLRKYNFRDCWFCFARLVVLITLLLFSMAFCSFSERFKWSHHYFKTMLARYVLVDQYLVIHAGKPVDKQEQLTKTNFLE